MPRWSHHESMDDPTLFWQIFCDLVHTPAYAMFVAVIIGRTQSTHATGLNLPVKGPIRVRPRWERPFESEWLAILENSACSRAMT